MLFIYFALIFIVYIVSLFVALFFEYPFRTIAKVVICPQKKIVRLKKDLAKQLKTNTDSIFEDEIQEEKEEKERLEKLSSSGEDKHSSSDNGSKKKKKKKVLSSQNSNNSLTEEYKKDEVVVQGGKINYSTTSDEIIDNRDVRKKID
jgi:hypothetical protein